MKRVIACLLALLLMFSFCACSEEETGSDPIVQAYLEKAQEFMDADDLDSAVAVLEEGIANTNASELIEMLDKVQATVEEETTEPTVAETEPAMDFSPYLGLWASDKCQMELTSSSDLLYLNMKCVSYRVLEFELDLSAKIDEQEQGKIEFAFDDDGCGNSGKVTLYLDDDVINYVLSDYVASSEYGIQTAYGGGSLTRATESMDFSETEPTQTELETEPTEALEAPTRPNYGGSEYLGTWQDTWSQRATMEIGKNNGYYEIVIKWPSGANETTVWMMWGVDGEGGSIFCDYSEKTIKYYDEYGNSDVYSVYMGGQATLYIYDGYLYWEDHMEDAGSNCCFEKVD